VSEKVDEVERRRRRKEGNQADWTVDGMSSVMATSTEKTELNVTDETLTEENLKKHDFEQPRKPLPDETSAAPS
jgi:hypothetical protein